jgi:hypothetical protein
MDHLLAIFQLSQSQSEADQTAAFDKYQIVLDDAHLCDLALELVRSREISDIEAAFAARCLRDWSRRHWPDLSIPARHDLFASLARTLPSSPAAPHIADAYVDLCLLADP